MLGDISVIDPPFLLALGAAALAVSVAGWRPAQRRWLRISVRGLGVVMTVLEQMAAPRLVDLVTSFSVMTHFEGFQKGVLDSRDILFFLSVIGFSLFTTSVILRTHRAG